MSNIHTTRTWFERWGAGDWEGVVDLVGDDFTARAPSFGLEFHGKDGCREFIHTWVDSFSNGYDGSLQRCTEVGNTVVAEFVAAGQHTATFNGIAATGSQVALPLLVVHGYSEDGRLIAHDLYIDAQSLLAQLVAEGGESVAVRTYSSGDVVVHEGDPSDHFFVIRAGELAVTREGAGDEPVASLGPGEFFGEVGLLTGAPRNATVTVRAGAEVAVVDGVGFRNMVMANPALADVVRAAATERR